MPSSLNLNDFISYVQQQLSVAPTARVFTLPNKPQFVELAYAFVEAWPHTVALIHKGDKIILDV